jgi:hypothetical protein
MYLVEFYQKIIGEAIEEAQQTRQGYLLDKGTGV